VPPWSPPIEPCEPAPVVRLHAESNLDLADGNLPANAHVQRWWPQTEVMKDAATVVGHDGYGTSMTALAAGLPQVLIPFLSTSTRTRVG
jgi:UDP:flavonoid glycosyltransferase YjiC (YdhE family)